MTKATIPATPETVLGLDMELVITVDRAFFSGLTSEIKGKEGRVVVISAQTPPMPLSALWEELNKSQILCDFAYCLPVIEEAAPACPHREELGWYKSYLWHKVRVSLEQGVTHYVSSDQAVHDVFRQHAPNIKRHYPWELCSKIELNNASDLLSKYPEIKRYGEAWVDLDPNQPVRCFHLTFRCDIAWAYAAIMKLGGITYSFSHTTNEALVIVPTNINTAHISKALGCDNKGEVLMCCSELVPCG